MSFRYVEKSVNSSSVSYRKEDAAQIWVNPSMSARGKCSAGLQMYSRRRLDQAQKLNISFQNFSIPREAISFMYSGIGISDNFS